MQNLSIDIETYSEIDIKKAGAYRYALDAEVMLFGYSVDFGEPECIDLMCGEEIPEEIVRAIFDPSVKKSAHNAAFERAVLRQYFLKLLNADLWEEGPIWQPSTWKIIRDYEGYLPPEQWQCTQVMCARAGYPLDLDSASVALGTAAKKDKKGRDLIRLFSVPCKPTKSNDMRTRNLPEHFPDRWQEFIDYCKQDVRTEQAIAKKLEWIPVLPEEEMYWHENEKMNERGLRIDMELVEGAMAIDEVHREKLLAEAQELTGIENPNSRDQILSWLNEEGDVEAETLTKESVKDMLAETDDDTVRRVLELRQEISKSSIKKYAAMKASVCPDGRVRGTVQFGGAARTFRNSGRIVQPQNLMRISMGDDELDLARETVKSRDSDMVGMMWDSVPNVLSQLIRTAICASEGHILYVCDYSSIEARFAAWVAGEEWVMDVFNTHGKIYEATASRMFNVPLEQITKDSPLRQQGKTASLGLQYGGGVNALTTMDYNKQIPDDDKPRLVRLFRESNPNIVKCWYDLERAAKAAINNPGDVFKVGKKGLAFCVKKGVLLFRLPSGRLLHYPKAHITQNRFGNDSVGFWGMDQTSRKWCKSETYGGKLFENLCQAGSRDVLMNGQHNAIVAGYHPILNVHDELVTEEKIGFGSVEELETLMCKKLDWMGDLPLKAVGQQGKYYSK